MLLARARIKFRAELRADFRQFYALCFDDMGRSFSISEAADLIALLPPESRTIARISPENSWGNELSIMARCANELSLIRWMQSSDGAKKRNRPKPILPPSRRDECENDDFESMGIETLKDFLNRYREEVDVCHQKSLLHI